MKSVQVRGRGDAAAGPLPWLTLVGLTEAGWSGIAELGRDAIRRAHLLVGSTRQLRHIPEQRGQQRLVWPSPIQPGIEQIMAWQGRPVCVLASGEPFWYGIGATLLRSLPASAMRTVSAPSAFAMAAARQGWSLQSCHCLSLVARPLRQILPALAPGRRLLLLSENGLSPAAVAALLCEAGFADSPMWAWQRLGGPEESLQFALAGAWQGRQVDALNTVALECVASRAEAGMARVAGRSEAAFAHDGQISKREVRAVILAYLAPRGGEHLWDLGAGSGAVSVEWLLADSGNTATAIERRPDRCRTIAANGAAFGVTGLNCVQRDLGDGLDGLAAPQAIFIGGGITSTSLVSTCWSALPEGGRLVASAVTLEGEATLLAARQRYGGSLVRLGVERSEALGSFQSMAALRSVTLWQVTKLREGGQRP